MTKPGIFEAAARSFEIPARAAQALRVLTGLSALIAFVLPVPGQLQTPLSLAAGAGGGYSSSLSNDSGADRNGSSASGVNSNGFSAGVTFGGGTGAALSAAENDQRILVVRNARAFSGVGVGLHAGMNGAGLDVATPLSGKFNLRAGGDFFSYSDSFETDGTPVKADLHLLSGHVALDWFPFGGSFRISPGVTLANQNRVQASAVLPGGSTVTLNGSSYTSSVTDPLNGSGSIDLRKTAPGLAAGFGNLVPRHGGHVSFPVDVGFIYVGQPRLTVNFTGSACDPGSPPALACQSVDENVEFQSSLAMFRTRLNKDLNYARFYPELSAGVGFSF